MRARWLELGGVCLVLSIVAMAAGNDRLSLTLVAISMVCSAVEIMDGP